MFLEMELLKKEMLERKVWAVVGASPKKDKFGYKIYKKLKARGYEVFPVHPGCDLIDGDKCYSSLNELPKIPECVNMVVPPRVTNSTLEEIVKLNINNVWLQPGTFDEETIALYEEKGVNTVYYDCILVALG